MVDFLGVSFCLVDYGEAGEFFLRIAENDVQREYVFITTVYSFYLKARSKGYRARLVTRFSRSIDDRHRNDIDVTFENLKEVRLGYVSKSSAMKFFTNVRKLIDEILSHAKIDPQKVSFLIWNGESVFGNVARLYKKELSCKTLFFEIANIPGKIFVDNEGVNKSSSLYSKPEQLDSLLYNDAEFHLWRSKFTEAKLLDSLPKQKKLGDKFRIIYILDFLYSHIFGYRYYSYHSIYAKLRIGVIVSFFNRFRKNTEPASSVPSKYIFFPMQVSTDTQLVFNSTYNNISALEHILNNYDGSVVIKPHPAERMTSYINKWLEASSHRDRVILSNRNTYELIAAADKVIVINSTVGLEAVIMGKEVSFLGDTFYRFLNENRLASYIQEYLVNIDFFCYNKNQFTLDNLQKIYSKAN